MQIYAKITIIAEENRKPYYFITFVNENKACLHRFLSDVGFNPDYG